jgi:hypothetical protein
VGVKIVYDVSQFIPDTNAADTPRQEIKAEGQNRQQMLVLAESMARTLNSVPSVEKIAALPVLRDTIKSFPDLMDETVDCIQNCLTGGICEKQFLMDGIFPLTHVVCLARFFNVSEHQAKIDNLKDRLNLFKEEFDRGVAIDSAVKVDDLKKSQGTIPM